jgi:hypothetical protein
MVPLRTLLENMGYNVGWDDQSKTVSATGGGLNDLSFGPGQYTLGQDNRSYISPTAMYPVAMGYMNSMNKPPTPEQTKGTFSTYSDLISGMYRPYYDASRAALDRQNDRIQHTADARGRTADVGYQQSLSNLQRKEGKDKEGLMRNAIGRGIYGSKLNSWLQAKMAGDYAPEYQQVETSKAASLANIAQQANDLAMELAGQGQKLEAEYLAKIGEGALNMVNQEGARRSGLAGQMLSLFTGMGNAAVNQGNQEAEQARWEAEFPIDSAYKQALTTAALRQPSGGGGSSGGGGTATTGGLSESQLISQALSMAKSDPRLENGEFTLNDLVDAYYRQLKAGYGGGGAYTGGMGYKDNPYAVSDSDISQFLK